MIKLIWLAGNNQLILSATAIRTVTDTLGPMDNPRQYCTTELLREHALAKTGHYCIMPSQVGGRQGERKQKFWKSFPPEKLFDEFGVRPRNKVIFNGFDRDI